MTAPTFTPAPWRRVGHRTIAAGTGPDRFTICELYSWGDCTEADANEALIEAAPELYAAASEVFALLDAGVLTVGTLAADHCRDIDDVRVRRHGRQRALKIASGLGGHVIAEHLVEAFLQRLLNHRVALP